MQTHYLSSNPAMLTKTLVPQQHRGTINVYVCMSVALSGQKDKFDDEHVHKRGRDQDARNGNG